MNVQFQPNFRTAERRLPFECVALVLQGGGALGAYQAGVYEALAEASINPDWVAGVSIGASTQPSSRETKRASGSPSCAPFGRRSPPIPCSTGLLLPPIPSLPPARALQPA
jgi:hypothetical protein